MLSKNPPIRDRKYLDHLRGQRCLLTGYSGSDYDAIDPMHIGTAGKGLKSGDDEVIPALHSIHHLAHHKGEMTVIRKIIPDDVLRDALRALARQHYREWKEKK